MMMVFPICFLAVSLGITGYYIYGNHTGPFVRCQLKAASSFCFVCFGALSYVVQPSSIYFPMMLGLSLGMLGDILLDLASCYREKKEYFFLSGLISFLLGHIAYVLCFMNHMHWFIEIAFCLVLALLLLLILNKLDCVFKEATIPVYAYSAIILFMVVQTGKYVYYKPCLYSVIIFVAAMLFSLSDLVLSFLLFQNRYHKPSLTWLNLSTYYMAQFLLAGSLYLVS